SSGADGRLAPHRLRRAALALLPRLRRGVRRTHARADVWERVRGVPRRRPALDTADDPMAAGMKGMRPISLSTLGLAREEPVELVGEALPVRVVERRRTSGPLPRPAQLVQIVAQREALLDVLL